METMLTFTHTLVLVLRILRVRQCMFPEPMLKRDPSSLQGITVSRLVLTLYRGYVCQKRLTHPVNCARVPELV